MQITSLDYSSFLGRIAVGKVARATIEGKPAYLHWYRQMVLSEKTVYENCIFSKPLGKKKVTEVVAGDICARLLVLKVSTLVILSLILKIRKHYQLSVWMSLP